MTNTTLADPRTREDDELCAEIRFLRLKLKQQLAQNNQRKYALSTACDHLGLVGPLLTLGRFSRCSLHASAGTIFTKRRWPR
jgi:hypothetical protein